MKMESRILGEPLFYSLGFMASVVGQYDMNVEIFRSAAFDSLHEGQELFLPVLGMTLANDRSIEHIERGKESSSSMPLIVVSHGLQSPFLQRQSGLCAVERLYLTLLIDA